MGNIMHSQAAAGAEVLMHLSSNVRRIRAASKMSQEQLASASGISRRMISGIETGQANVSLATVDRLASALGVSFSALVREPDAVDSREIRGLAWQGERPGSEATLLGAAPGGGETEMWLWSLAPGERYHSEAGSDAWHEMIFMLQGSITIELEGQRVDLRQGEFKIFSSPTPYAFANEDEAEARFLRNIALSRRSTFPNDRA